MSIPKLNISQTFTEVDAEAIRRGPPMPDAPLPLSVELAQQVEGQWSGETGHVERDAALIDARVRPLVEALRAVRTVEVHEPNERLPIEVYDLVRAALRAAGDG